MKNWFALYVQPRKEKVVEKELLRNNYEAFLPIKKCLRQWKDRKKMVEMPLIPSYVFVFIELQNICSFLLLINLDLVVNQNQMLLSSISL